MGEGERTIEREKDSNILGPVLSPKLCPITIWEEVSRSDLFFR